MHIRGMINEISHSKGAAVPFAFLIGHSAVGIGALNAPPLGSCVCMEESDKESTTENNNLICRHVSLRLIN